MERYRVRVNSHVVECGVVQLHCPAPMNTQTLLRLASTWPVELQFSEWMETATEVLQLKPAQAEGLFEVYLHLEHVDVEEFTLRTREELGAVDGNELEDYIKYRFVQRAPFLLFLFLQLTERTAPQSPRNHPDAAWPEHDAAAAGTSPSLAGGAGAAGNSPRLSVSKIGNIQSKLALQESVQHHVEKHLRDAISLAAGGKDMVDQDAVRALEFLLSVEPIRGEPIPLENVFGRAFPASVPFVESTLSSVIRGSSWPPVQLQVVGGKLSVNESLKSGSLDHPGLFHLEGISKVTIFKSVDDVKNLDVRIVCSQQCNIFLLAPLRSVTIYGCRKCNVTLGPVTRGLFIEHCEKVQVSVCCRGLYASDNTDTVINTCTNLRPVLSSSNRGLILGPLNSFYGTLEDHLVSSGVNPLLNKWNHPILLGGTSLTNCWSEQDPKDYFMHVCPYEIAGSTKICPSPVPNAYADALEDRARQLEAMKKKIRSTHEEWGCGEEIQNHIKEQFKEWLVSSGHTRLIYDLIKSGGGGGGGGSSSAGSGSSSSSAHGVSTPFNR